MMLGLVHLPGEWRKGKLFVGDVFEIRLMDSC